jgi:hypothetical protein
MELGGVMLNKSWWLDGVWLALVGLLSTTWCVAAAWRIGPTFDEPFYIAAGLQSWRQGTAKPLVDKGVMPLPMYMATGPLYLWEKWRGRPIDPVADMNALVPAARMASLTFWMLFLIYSFAAGRLLAGPWGGRLAVALVAFEPTVLAHASLATADLAAVAFLLAFLVHFHLGREREWWRRVGWPAAWYALALLAKASALPFGILGMVVLHGAARRPESEAPGGWRARIAGGIRWLTAADFRRDLVQVTGITLVLVFVLVGSDGKPSPSFQAWAATLPEGPSAAGMRWLADHLRIFSNAGNALAYQIRHNISGSPAFLLGTSSPRAVSYYFPVALSIKLTLSLLALPLVIGLLTPGALRNWACALAAVFLLFSLHCRVQTGVRFMLPLISVAALGLAAALVHAARAGPAWRRGILVLAGTLTPLWAAWSAWSVWPHGLCYTNELWGGTAAGYRLLCDSNYDWGQGLPELRSWAREHGPVDVWYFGTDPAVSQAPLCALPFGHRSGPGLTDVQAQRQARYLAVGTTIAFSTQELWPGAAAVLQQLRRTPPLARTTTFLIYDWSELSRQAAGNPWDQRGRRISSSQTMSSNPDLKFFTRAGR